LQDSHTPEHASLQHTPSAQYPLAHASFMPHGVPSANLGLHAFALQKEPYGHSPFVVQP
jgi:hypothetical protein